MGRSSLQGTPWHYEYLKSQSKSKRCAFNVGYCSNAASLYHGKKCVGKAECEEFERGSHDYVEDYNEKKEKRKLKAKEKAKAKKEAEAKEKAVAFKKLNSMKDDTKKIDNSELERKENPEGIERCDGVKPGDSITIEDIKTHEMIDLDISDPKNPFVGKALSQSAEIHDEFYKVVRINERKVNRKIK